MKTFYETPQGAVDGRVLQGMQVRRSNKPWRDNKNPKDWRHQNYDYLVPLGRDIFVYNLSYEEIAKKYGISSRTVFQIAKKLAPKNKQRVRLGRYNYEWREKQNMKITLEIELENRAWSPSELILALSKTISTLELARMPLNKDTRYSGPITDRQNNSIGQFKIETFEARATSNQLGDMK